MTTQPNRRQNSNRNVHVPRGHEPVLLAHGPSGQRCSTALRRGAPGWPLGGLLSLLCLGVLLLLTPLRGRAQQSDWAEDWQQSEVASDCVPSCRDGFFCQGGECVPMCAPPCRDDAYCSPSGICVSNAPEPVRTPDPPPRAHPAICQPACRSGYTCIGGRCVSACNPPCPADQICSPKRECIARPQPVTRAPDESNVSPEPHPAAQPKPKPKPKPRRPRKPRYAKTVANLHLNAAGPFQFGLTPTLELGTIVSGYLRVRILNTGIASYLLLPGDAASEFSWGLGGALGLHIFSAKAGYMRGFFGGVALEYVYSETEDRVNNLATYRTHSLIPQLDIGYRWGLGRFLIGIGLAAGIAVPVSTEDVPLVEYGCRVESCDGTRDIQGLTNLLIDVGVFF